MEMWAFRVFLKEKSPVVRYYGRKNPKMEPKSHFNEKWRAGWGVAQNRFTSTLKDQISTETEHAFIEECRKALKPSRSLTRLGRSRRHDLLKSADKFLSISLTNGLNDLTLRG